MSSSFIKADLHIHTPASSCYKGTKDEFEYLNIVKAAKSKGLSIIALTDHNTIKGYKKLLEIKTRLISKIEELDSIDDSDKATEKKQVLTSTLSLFDDLLIVPGVEFEVKNGIHLLVLFDPETDLEVIEEFLRSGGYQSKHGGYEDPPTLSNWEVLDLYEQASTLGCVIIDAHTDSDKGLYNTLPKGMYRSKCFQSDALHAACYKSESEKDKLKNILESSVDYKRNVPLSFIKSSDAHVADEVGSVFTYLKTETLSFADLKNALRNPAECVSIDPPKTSEILEKLINKENVYGIRDLGEGSLDYFKKVVCALNNTMGGYCLFGLTDRNNKIGIDIEDPEDPKELNNIVNALNQIEPRVNAKFNAYPLQQENKIIFSVHINKGKDLISIENENKIYGVLKGDIKALNAREVQLLVEDNYSDHVETQINSRIEKIKTECSLISSLFRAQSIIRDFQDNSSKIAEIIGDNAEIIESVKVNKELETKLVSAFNDNPHGKTRGMVSIMNEPYPPRLQYAYLRYSLPVHYVQGFKSGKASEGVYLTIGGGAFYSAKDYEIYSNNGLVALKISSNNKSLSNKFLCAFLKSSFLIWYVLFKFDNHDLLLKEIFDNLLVPKIRNEKEKAIVAEIDTCFDAILAIEKEFLSISDNDERNESVESHNQKIDELAYKIDLKIYDLLRLSSAQINEIEEFLRAKQIYLPKIEDE